MAKVTWGKTTFKLFIEPYKEKLEQLHANNCLKSMKYNNKNELECGYWGQANG